MKARIDANGTLEIERAGVGIKQFCPWNEGDDGTPRQCGGWCPLFEELGDAFAGQVLHLCCSGESTYHDVTADARPKKAGGA